MAGCQNSEDETLPCTNSTAGPVRPLTDSTATASRSVGIRSATMPGSSLFVTPRPAKTEIARMLTARD